MAEQRAPASHRGDGPVLSRRVRSWAVALLVADVLLVLAFFAHFAARTDERLRFFSYWRWHGEHDRSFVELFGAAQLVAAAVLLVLVWWRVRDAPVYCAWASLLLVMAADELGRLHENGSHYLRTTHDLPTLPGLRPDDTGELLSWFVLGIVPVAAVLVFHLRSRGLARRNSWRLAGLCALLAGFALGLDMIYVLVMDDLEWTQIAAFVVAESTGELIMTSAILVFAIWIADRSTTPPI